MLKKLSSAFALLMISGAAINAQEFTYSYGLNTNDTVPVSTFGAGIKTDEGYSNTLNIDGHVVNNSANPQVIKWTYITDSTDAPAGWILIGTCDNVSCRTPYSEFYYHEEQTSGVVAVGDKTLFEPRIYCPTSSANGVGVYRFKIRSFNAADTTVETHSDFYTFIVTKDPTGISSIAVTDNRVSVYPNPATNSVVVFANKSLNATKISVSSITGQTVATSNIAKGSEVTNIDINALAKGTYMVHIIDEKGQLVTARKFVKK